MASTNFTIPLDKAALLEQGDGYFVRAVYDISEMSAKLKQARERLQKESFEFIFEAFPVYYSVIHHEESLRFDIIKRAFADLHTALRNFNDALGSALEDKDSLNDELKSKYLNLIKMLVYIYVQVVTLLVRVGALSNRASLLPAKTKSKDTVFMNKTSIIELISNIAEKPINLLWEPSVVEEKFVILLSEISYSFILNPSIESDKDLKVRIFNLIASLINNCNHGAVFVRMSVKMVKSNIHLALCIPEGVHQLVKNLNCKESLVHDLVKEATEWQIEEQFQDCDGAWHCSMLVSEMADLMPDLMSPEVSYLSKYLAHNAVPLKNAVLIVIAKVLVKHSDNHSKEYRDQLLVTLTEHLNDISDSVRGKCFELLATIHVEGVKGLIPPKHQHIILKEAIRHLQEKKPNVRRFAANCISQFLSENHYGMDLHPEEAQCEISRLQPLLNKIIDHISDGKNLKRKESELMWNLIVQLTPLKSTIEKELEKDPDPADTKLSEEEVNDIIRLHIIHSDFLSVFQLCRTYFDKFETFRKIKDEMKEAKEVDLFLAVMRDIYVGLRTTLEPEKIDQEVFRHRQILEEAIAPYRDFVTFVDLIESAVKPMVKLLDTTERNDLIQATEFFVFAYRFNVRNVYDGILAMLKLLKKPDQERNSSLMQVLQTILLNTDKSTVEEHAATVVNRLITLLNKVPEDNIGDLQALIAEWTAKGKLADVMTDKLWQYFSQKVPVTQSVSRSALILLRMAAEGSRAIIGTNIKAVAEEAFSQRAVEDALFMSACLNFLQVACNLELVMKRQPLFKIANNDPIFTNLLRFLAEEFFVPKMYFSKVIESAIDFIYRTNSKPEKLCEEIMTKVIAAVAAYVTENGEREVQMFVLTRICVLLRAISLWQTKVLGHDDYRDLKRRHLNKPIVKKNRHSASEGSSISGESLPIQTSNEEFEIKGALVEDEDAEFILNILEKDTVTGSGGLSKLARIVVNICQRPNRYNNEAMQDNAVKSLIQYMMISSEFCDDHLKVLLTLLEDSKFPLVKIIIIRRTNLLQRYPHIVDPWMDAMVNRLKDQNMKVRRCAFSSLSRLIMEDSIWVRDMTHVCSRISALVRCIVSEDSQLRSLSKNLFLQLAERDSNLVYNILPDVWSDLAESGDMKEEDLKTIMKFLFYLTEKTKHMENLVDCFCKKFCEPKYHHLCANISYCLSLIEYNKKTLNKLLDNFDNYKPFLDIPDVHNNFQQILKACSKNQTAKTDLKIRPNNKPLETKSRMFKSNRKLIKIKERHIKSNSSPVRPISSLIQLNCRLVNHRPKNRCRH